MIIKMKDKDIKEKFRITDSMIGIDENRKQDTLLFLQKNIVKKEIGVLHDRKKILYNQIRYMDKEALSIHLLLCLVLLSVTVVLSCYNRKQEEVIMFSMVFSGVLGIASVVEISRIFFSGIAELSESCYFNVKQIVAFHMLLSGIINLTVLSVGIIFVSFRWKINLVQIGLYILVPLIIAECCCLWVLLTETGRRSIYPLIMIGIFVIVFYMIMACEPELYQVTALTLWGIIFIIGLCILGIQIKILFRGIEKGEIICTN